MSEPDLLDINSHLSSLPLGQKGWHVSGDAVGEHRSSAANVHQPFPTGLFTFHEFHLLKTTLWWFFLTIKPTAQTIPDHETVLLYLAGLPFSMSNHVWLRGVEPPPSLSQAALMCFSEHVGVLTHADGSQLGVAQDPTVDP
ncbi:BTB/POZ domain-containing protein 16 [Athene cunicularia]|uniref:BTB/POZ domain-containing protein 16 n=1 Tax=Athene cunicularia TaxID=194338 RepID=UPI000EF69277|nr:BTB/POZ domain-containing protein 16 [Athene cunicularia]